MFSGGQHSTNLSDSNGVVFWNRRAHRILNTTATFPLSYNTDPFCAKLSYSAPIWPSSQRQAGFLQVLRTGLPTTGLLAEPVTRHHLPQGKLGSEVSHGQEETAGVVAADGVLCSWHGLSPGC